jgi:hypothetical protein
MYTKLCASLKLYALRSEGNNFMNLREIFKRFGDIFIFVILTLLISVYIGNLTNLGREELRGVPLGPPMLSVTYSTVWSVISAYMIIYYSLKAGIYCRGIKVGITGLCLIIPWLLPRVLATMGI